MRRISSALYHTTKAGVSGVGNSENVARESLVRAALNPKSFRYVEQLSAYLQQHFILHEPRRFLIIPKPYGVSCVGEKTKDGGVFKNSVFDADEKEQDLQMSKNFNKEVTLSECIPFLSSAFREPKLHFCIGLKRYLSGAIVLPANDQEFKNLTNSMKYISQTTYNHGEYHYRCIALLMGSPPQKSDTVTGYATFQKVGNHSEYIFVPGKSYKRAKAGKFAVEGTMEYNVIAHKNGCSLVEFGVNKFARHLPRLIFSHMMCPILGDPIYSSRLVEVDGKPVLVNPNQKNRGAKLWFPKRLTERLGKPASELQKGMPLFCHVYKTIFPRYGWTIGRPQREQDVLDLLASAPPQPHFLAMVEALDMHSSLASFLRGEESDLDNIAVQGETSFT